MSRSADFAAAQIDAIFADIEVAAVKIGMLACGAIAEEVADRLAFYKPRFIVLDPVLTATSGDALATSDTATAIVRHLFPLATLITPNISEAARLSGHAIAADLEGMRRAAKLFHARGAKAVLIKGGHVGGATSDDLLSASGSYRLFSAPRDATRNTHGTGCTLSSAIAAYLAQGLELGDAIGAAKTYLSERARGSRSAFRRPWAWAGPSLPRIVETVGDFWKAPARPNRPHELAIGGNRQITGFQIALFPIWDAATAKVPPHIGALWHFSQKSVVWGVYGP